MPSNPLGDVVGIPSMDPCLSLASSPVLRRNLP